MPAYRQFVLQAAAAFFVLSLAWFYYHLPPNRWDWGSLTLLIGTCAFSVAYITRQPWWWLLIHGFFAPLVWLGQQLTLSPLWHLAAFFLLLFIYRGAASGQIPLYLSGKKTAAQLATLLPANVKLLDIGAGIGSLLVPLARQRPDLQLSGIDNAPFPWIIGKIRTLPFSKISWHWGNLWRHNLSPYNAVYCFLSPVPMEAIWEKATREMMPDSFLISKCFPIHGATPESIENHNGDSTDTLFIYRIPRRS